MPSSTTGTKVIAAFDHAGCFRVAEQTLKLAFFGGVAFLNFCAAGVQRFYRVSLGRPGCTAAAVTAGTSAEKNDDIPVRGTFTTNVFRGSRSNNGTDLHALGSVTVMIELVNLPGGKTNLVAVGRVTGSCGGDELFLGQLALQSFADASQRVGSAGNTHSGINIAASGQRVTDGTTDTGGSTAKRFDLRRVVVSFVLEEKEPVLSFSVDIYLDLYGAGIDLLGFVQLVQHAHGFQITCTDGTHVHQSDGLRAVEFLAGTDVFVIGGLELGIVGLDRVDYRIERGVTAVIGPIGIYDTDLRDAGIPSFGTEIVPAADKVTQIHGQAFFPGKCRQLVFVIGNESVQDIYGLGYLILNRQCLNTVQGGFPALHRIDDMFFYCGQIFGR